MAAGSLALGFAAGSLSTLSPCVLPLLPVLLLGALQQHRWAPLALAAGLAVSFTAAGLLLAGLGFAAGLDEAALRAAAAALMLAVGAVLLSRRLQDGFARLAAPLTGGAGGALARWRFDGLGGQFLLGALLGLVWAPCTGPTLGAAVGLAASGDGLAQAATVMAAFSLGAATPVLALAYGGRRAMTARRQSLDGLARKAKPAMGAVLAAVGLLVLTGADKAIETWLLQASPAWLIALTTGI